MLDHLSDDELLELRRLFKSHNLKSNDKRRADIIEHGYSTKFAYHVVRLYAQIEQIMVEHDLDIQRNSELLKAIRRGEWTLDRLTDWVAEKEKSLEGVYATSTLRDTPDEDAIKALLFECLEMHYGSLTGAVERNVPTEVMIRELREVLDRHERRLPASDTEAA